MAEAGKPEARRLPPGSHGIPAEVVARNQRERLVAAMAEACAERGYAGTSVADVAKRAGVSSVTFYQQFAGKRDCMLAAHRQLLGRLLEGVDRVREAEGESEAGSAGGNSEAANAGGESEAANAGGESAAAVRATICAALALFAADPPSARLLTVEILAAGPQGAKRHDATVAAFAERLGCGWVPAAGMLALVGKLVLAGEAQRLPALEDELVASLLP